MATTTAATTQDISGKENIRMRQLRRPIEGYDRKELLTLRVDKEKEQVRFWSNFTLI
jgi:hypothetical protein